MSSSSHKVKVGLIVDQLLTLSRVCRSVAFQKHSVPHIVPDARDPRFHKPKIDLRAIDEILEIDASGRTCTAESGVTFAKLVAATLKSGLIPLTVPELKTITVGGAVTGCSVESMSYRYGGFHDSCLEYEVVTSDGRVLVCSPETNSEIFHMLHGSYGTLGILTKLKFRLIPAKPLVHLLYLKFRSGNDFWQALRQCCSGGEYDFVDGIVHGRDRFVICAGIMTYSAPYISSFTGGEVYYKSTLTREEDYMKLYDYLFRYDRDCHWVTKRIPLLEVKVVRRKLGRFILGSSNIIKWSRRLRFFLRLLKRPVIMVDTFIPARNFIEFLSWYVREFRFYPLWIVPYMIRDFYPWISEDYRRRMNGEKLFIDCAVYGKSNNHPHIDLAESLERKTYDLGGIKTLISSNYYDEETFWKIYNRPLYKRIKAKLDPENIFGGLYEKLHPHRKIR